MYANYIIRQTKALFPLVFFFFLFCFFYFFFFFFFSTKDIFLFFKKETIFFCLWKSLENWELVFLSRAEVSLGTTVQKYKQNDRYLLKLCIFLGSFVVAVTWNAGQHRRRYQVTIFLSILANYQVSQTWSYLGLAVLSDLCPCLF